METAPESLRAHHTSGPELPVSPEDAEVPIKLGRQASDEGLLRM